MFSDGFLGFIGKLISDSIYLIPLLLITSFISFRIDDKLQVSHTVSRNILKLNIINFFMNYLVLAFFWYLYNKYGNFISGEELSTTIFLLTISFVTLYLCK